MIAGLGGYLCRDCSEHAAQQLAPRLPSADSIRCNFCRQRRLPPDVTHIGTGAVCADCLGVMAPMFQETSAMSLRSLFPEEGAPTLRRSAATGVSGEHGRRVMRLTDVRIVE